MVLEQGASHDRRGLGNDNVVFGATAPYPSPTTQHHPERLRGTRRDVARRWKHPQSEVRDNPHTRGEASRPPPGTTRQAARGGNQQMSLATDAKSLPLFYHQVRMLNSMRDQDLCLMPPSDYYFAAGTNSIPLVAEEFFAAQAHYPIVFAGAENPTPVAIVGLRNDENLFVDADGTWRADAYLPLYVRRHPFIFIKGNNDTLHLGIDAACPRLSTDHGQ